MANSDQNIGELEPHARKTKIVATVGPASRSPEMVHKLIDAGVNVFRLNFSHGTHEEHSEVLKTIRKTAADMKQPIAILQDLSGPKIRISAIEGDYFSIDDGGTIDLKPADGSKTDPKTIFVESVNPVSVLKAGHHILLADGIIELRTLEVKSDKAVCEVVKGGRMRSRVGIAFPDSHINLPAATDKDLVDLQWAIKHDLEYVAISFVMNAADILRIRDIIKKEGKRVGIVSKIERKSALENIDEIVDVSDGLMVARGDLGLELPLEYVPMAQKKLIEKANHRGIPVIVATQMLHSMITSIRPTRAEVSDIAAAVMAGADAVMLSEETAIGEHPLEAVRYLGKIARQAEQSFVFDEFKLRLRDADRATVPDAVAYAAAAAAIKVNASAIIACTETGTSARLLAKYRPQQRVYGASHHDSTLRRMALYWGVVPIALDKSCSHEDEASNALKAVQLRENLPNGSRAVVTGGIAVGAPGSTSVLEIREMSFK